MISLLKEGVTTTTFGVIHRFHIEIPLLLIARLSAIGKLWPVTWIDYMEGVMYYCCTTVTKSSDRLTTAIRLKDMDPLFKTKCFYRCGVNVIVLKVLSFLDAASSTSDWPSFKKAKRLTNIKHTHMMMVRKRFVNQ